jgi:hypothetical protein
MRSVTLDMIMNLISRCYAGWRDVLETGQHSTLDSTYTALQPKNTCNSVMCNVPLKLQQTREWFLTLFSKSRVVKSGPGQRGGLKYQKKYRLTHSELSHTVYLFTYHPVPRFTGPL